MRRVTFVRRAVDAGLRWPLRAGEG